MGMPVHNFTPEQIKQQIKENAEAFKNNAPTTSAEAADVIFHYLVMLKSREINFDDVMKELKSRTSKSGLREKEERL